MYLKLQLRFGVFSRKKRKKKKEENSNRQNNVVGSFVFLLHFIESRKKKSIKKGNKNKFTEIDYIYTTNFPLFIILLLCLFYL